MNCLILAAGYGSRLRMLSESKPLTPVAGIALIEHVMRRAMAGGATRFTVVTGHEAARVEAFVHGLGAELRVPVAIVRVGDASKANGHSVVAGSAELKGNYLLTMADHLVDPAIFKALTLAPPDDLLLAVDRSLGSSFLDIDDATKVRISADRAILSIGKAIQDYNAIDTGAFLATPALALSISEIIAEGGSGSLSEGVQRLADRGRARAVDVTGLAWIDVDDPRSHGLAEAWLGELKDSGV